MIKDEPTAAGYMASCKSVLTQLTHTPAVVPITNLSQVVADYNDQKLHYITKDAR